MTAGAATGKLAGWLGRLRTITSQVILRLVHLFHSLLHAIGQDFSNPIGERRPIVAPAPNRHAADLEIFRRLGVAAKDYFEQQIMPTAGQFPLKVRGRCGAGTRCHASAHTWLLDMFYLTQNVNRYG
jgi:hypothetical protein